jgi:hypothetical protein
MTRTTATEIGPDKNGDRRRRRGSRVQKRDALNGGTKFDRAIGQYPESSALRRVILFDSQGRQLARLKASRAGSELIIDVILMQQLFEVAQSGIGIDQR